MANVLDDTAGQLERLSEPAAKAQLRLPRLPQGDVADSLQGRRFLIVTAPFGRFGRLLADVLSERGAVVSRMMFNAGDLAFWRRANGIRFTDGVEQWPARFEALADEFTDIIVFGESGPYNQAVLSIAGGLRAKVWVLENGYFRPDWITLERNGVNASSQLPRHRSGYAAPAPETLVVRPVGRILPHHIINISLYHACQLPGRLMFPKYSYPYTQSAWLQFLGHVRRYVSLAFQSKVACEVEAIAAKGPFFLACLQREGDAQLLRYSQYADNTAFLAEVMSSFARQAPADARLVVKNHPLDPGLVNLRHITRCLAVERGLADRVDFIDGGNLAQLCRASQGMVVNNSSAALSALGFHTPVKVLGEAFFDFDGLTDQQPLDAFWGAPQGPDVELFVRFRAHVIARSQVNGNYHEPRAMGATARGVADFIEVHS